MTTPPDLRVELTLFLGLFACYAASAYPTIAPRDSADMAAAAVSLGVAHPPGYPLYSTLGHAWLSWLGLGNFAYRLNLMAAAGGAAAVAGVYALLRRKTGFWPALAGALTLAWSAPLWKFSLLEEKYSFHALFAVVFFLLAEGERSSAARRLFLTALLFGLSLVNHQSMILLAPALAYLWRAEFKRHGAAFSSAFGPAAIFFLLGLGLYAAVAVRLSDARLAWAVITRAEYGSFTLAEQFSRPFSAALAGDLLVHFIRGLGQGTSWLVLLAAMAGFLELRKKHSALGWGLALAWLGFGPGFFLMTKFDVSGWVARSVLETAFIVPCVMTAVAAGFGLERLRNFSPAPALVLAGLSIVLHHAAMDHRDDFAAYDYAMDIRRILPPGSAAVVAGDTAQFSLKYLDLVKPPAPGDGRLILGSLEFDKRRWIDEQMRARPVYAVGISREMMAELGLWKNPYFLSPGLIWRIEKTPRRGDDSALWALSVRRPSRAEILGDSYSRDIRFSYAHARYQSAQLMESLGSPGRAVMEDYQRAAVLDPEDYQLERVAL